MQRRAGSRLRISARLVDAKDGYERWSERDDREVLDVFAVQDEIARSIVGELAAQLAGDASVGATRPPTRDVFASFEKSIPYLGVFLRVLVGLAAVVSTLVVMLAMYTTITERTREIGILKAMGASRGYIVGIIEKEAILISVIGLLAGFAVSLVAGYLIHKAYGLVFEYSWAWATVAASIGVGGGIVGALYPAWRASNLDPVNALAYE